MKKLVASLVLGVLASVAQANGEFLDAFLTHYKVKDDAPLGVISCGVCHVSDSDFAFNAYGKEMKKAMTDRGATTVDAALLASIEPMDSDGDGKSNIDEITGGTNPGDASSGGTGPAPETAPKEAAHFPPKNAYHPAIVHFPIALFIGGLILDLLGLIRRDKTMLQAGWYCIVMAAVTAIGGILSGVGAMALQKLPYRGLIYSHLTYAIASSVIMWIMVAMRVHRHEKMNVPMRVIYYILALACFAMISWAGHLGGVFVYGE